MSKKKLSLSRRQFLGGTMAAAGLLVVPRYVLGGQPGTKAPSDRVTWALIGNGTRGGQQAGGNAVICDVDASKGGKYQDFRKMLDEMDKTIDACLIATPDHTHAVIAMACIKRGKHVYVEKPMAHSIGEIRALGKAAQEHKVVTQVGNQGHSYESCARFVEFVRDGCIGKIKEVHCFHDGNNSAINDIPKLKEEHPIPAGMDWDLWIGPAKYRGFNPMFHPHNWRRWSFFGTGTAGDWTCHIVDPAFWALELQYPTSVEAVKVDGYDPKLHSDTFAPGKCIKFEFPAKGDRGPITLTWYDGSCRMSKPAGWEEGKGMPATGGIILGDKGGMTFGVWGADPFRMYPEKSMQDYLNMPEHKENKGPPKTIKRGGEHHKDFYNAIAEGRPAGCDFATYGGPLTEVALLSIIAMNFPGQKLLWDGPNAKFTNNDEANKMVNPPYREGWTL
jgi:predicted dehydrogenase